MHFPYLIRASSICRIARIEFAITSPLSNISPLYALSLFEKSRARISTPLIISRSNSASRTGSNTNSSPSGAAVGTLYENVVSVLVSGASVVSGIMKKKENKYGGGSRDRTYL